jgi:hypothetical protein
MLKSNLPLDIYFIFPLFKNAKEVWLSDREHAD